MPYRFLRYPEGKPKAFTMSYDDGPRADLRFAETITKYGLKCTFNLVNFPQLTVDEIKEHIIEKGHEIAVHTSSHRALGLIRPIEGIKEVLECRLELEKKFDMIIRGMAYPDSGITRFQNGAEYSNIKKYLNDLNLAYSRTLGGDNNSFELPTDWHAWMPTCHHGNPKILEYIDEFVAQEEASYIARRYPRLFYLWGHSFEFDHHKNWELLDEICERISGKDDIWYATNIEIYDYVTAYNSLIYSADETIVYNPTLIKVWFTIGDKNYSINPGETLRI